MYIKSNAHAYAFKVILYRPSWDQTLEQSEPLVQPSVTVCHVHLYKRATENSISYQFMTLLEHYDITSSGKNKKYTEPKPPTNVSWKHSLDKTSDRTIREQNHFIKAPTEKLRSYDIEKASSSKC